MGSWARRRPSGVSRLARVVLGGVERAELVQQVDAVLDAAAVGRVDEREGLDVAEPERAHLQDDAREVGAQDLGVGELGPLPRSPASEYIRMQMPSATRPQRPLRWFALACETGSIGSRCTFVR